MKILLYDDDGRLIRTIEDLKSIYVGEYRFEFIKRDGTYVEDGVALDLYDTYKILEDDVDG